MQMSPSSTYSSWWFPFVSVSNFKRKMENEIDFGDLSKDENFKQRILGFRDGLEKASQMLQTFFNEYNYEELSLEDRVRYDLFVAFAVNSYFWMYLRVRGLDPSQHDITSQISRVKEYMNKSKQLYEKKTLMPRIDKGAAERFIRSGLWSLEQAQKTCSNNETAGTSL